MPSQFCYESPFNNIHLLLYLSHSICHEINTVMPPTSIGGHYEVMAAVCRVPRPNSTTEWPSKPKIGNFLRISLLVL